MLSSLSNVDFQTLILDNVKFEKQHRKNLLWTNREEKPVYSL